MKKLAALLLAAGALGIAGCGGDDDSAERAAREGPTVASGQVPFDRAFIDAMAITPPKLIPPFQSTAASGTLPIEQTKLMIATTGPMIGPQTLASVSLSSRKSVCQNDSGTQAARAPAIASPPTMSIQIAAQSITK